MLTTFKTFSTGLRTSFLTSWRNLKRNESMRTARQMSRDPWNNFGMLVRAIFIGFGLVFLGQYRFQNLFGSILGLAFTIGPIVTIESVKIRIESLLTISSNRISQKVIGKEVFVTEQRNFSAQTVIGHLHGDLIQNDAERREKREEERAINEDWTVARDFTLPGTGDAREFRLKMSRGDHLKGYVSADDEMCAYVLTENSRQSFRNGFGFNPLSESEWETHAKVDFVALKTGTYYFIVTNEPDDEEDDSDYYDVDDEADDTSVELRLRH